MGVRPSLTASIGPRRKGQYEDFTLPFTRVRGQRRAVRPVYEAARHATWTDERCSGAALPRSRLRCKDRDSQLSAALHLVEPSDGVQVAPAANRQCRVCTRTCHTLGWASCARRVRGPGCVTVVFARCVTRTHVDREHVLMCCEVRYIHLYYNVCQ